MKARNLFLICLMATLSMGWQSASAQTPQGNDVIMTIENDGHNTGSNQGPKVPPSCPVVSIDGHTLYFTGSHAEFILTLTDEDDNVVYVTNVYATDTQIALPSSLSGVFKLRLYTDIYCFVGEITLY